MKNKGFSAKAHDLSVSLHKPTHMDKYEVESAAHTLTRHQEIKADKKLHRAAKKHLMKKHKLEAKAIKEK